MVLTAQGKFIDTRQIERLFTQGEKYSDRIHFVLPSSNNDVDVSGCTFVMRTVASDGSMTETILDVQYESEQILLTWNVPETVTAVPGMLELELVGSRGTDIIIKYKMPAVFVKGAVMGGSLPAPDVIEEKLAQMNDILAQAQAKLDEAKNIAPDIIDPTLTIAGKAADAKVTGDRLTELTNTINDISGSISSGGIAQTLVEVMNARTSPGLGNRKFDSLSERLEEEFSEKASLGEHLILLSTVAELQTVQNQNIKKINENTSSASAANEKAESLLSQMEITNDIARDAQYKANLLHSQVNGILDNIDGTQFLGNSATATKLQTERHINGVAFDGSKNITVPINGCYHYDDSANATTVSWHKVASCTLNRGSYDAHAVFHVYRSLGKTPYGGILKAHIRTTPEGLYENSQLVWEYAYNIPKEDFVLSVIQNETDNSTTAELWVKINIRYAGYQFALLSESNRTTARNGIWTLYNSSVGQATYTESDIVTVSDFMEIQNPVELSDSGWIQIPINLGNGEVYYRKYGKMVEVKGTIVPVSDANTLIICTLPEEYRPSIIPVASIVTESSTDKTLQLRVAPNGSVSLSGFDTSKILANKTYNLSINFLIGGYK